MSTMAVALITSASAMAQAPAFPGAEGFGRYTTGGRGGKIVHVTNLNNSGTGSLRAAVSGTAKKTVVFDVGGIIELASELTIGANTTILGQTAPGQGITLRYYTVRPNGDNIIIRFIRVRHGEEKDVDDGADAMFARHFKNVIIDHCSMSWSIDEVASFYDNRDFTLQWSTVAEGLNHGHTKGEHSYGGIWGGKNASFHHNLIAHCTNRTPRFNGARYGWSGYDQTVYANTVMAERVDFRNCVMYNWGTGNGCYGGPGGGFINIINNYYKYGPATSNKYRVTQCSINKTAGSGETVYGIMSRYYINGNYVYGKGASYDWKGVIDDAKDNDIENVTFTDANDYYGEGAGASIKLKMTEPIDAGTVTTHSAETTYQKVLQYAGASLSRDAQDTRYVTETTNGTTTYTGSIEGYKGIIDIVADQGSYTLDSAAYESGYDTDGDGIPDAWETANGLNPNDASDAITYTLDSKGYYTNIEVYANSIVQDIMLAGNADADDAVEEYYPKYTKTDGTVVEAINGSGSTPVTPDDTKTEVASGSITWSLTSGAAESATVSSDISQYVSSTSMTAGSNLTIDGTTSVNDVTLTKFTATAKEADASTTNDVTFTINLADGVYFTPTKVSLIASRLGTDSGVFDLQWKSSNGSITIASSQAPNRNKEANGWYTSFSQDITDIAAASGEQSLNLYIYGVTAAKAMGIGNLVIEGKISQNSTAIQTVKGSDATSVEYFNLQGMRIAQPVKGAYIVVTKDNNGNRISVKKIAR